MRKVIAHVDEEQQCPLYRKGDALEFDDPSVQGVDYAPICVRAVGMIRPHVGAVRNGDEPDKHWRLYCGGCGKDHGNKAWFTLRAENIPTISRIAPKFAEFAILALTKTKLFAGVRTNALHRILPLLRERHAGDGEELLTRGQQGRALFLIVSGQYQVIQLDDRDVEHEITMLGPGDSFGETSLLTGEPASATVRAIGSGALLVVSKEDFPRLLSVVPSIGMTLAQVLANRVARASSWILEEIKRGLIGRLDLIPPVEIIQAMSVNNQTGTLTLQSEKRSGLIYFQEGQITHVQAGELSGEDAFFACLAWRRGTFRFEPGARELQRTIHQDTVGLLLEGLRRMDETTKLPAPEV